MNKSRATILVADDNPDIVRLIQVNLKFEGYHTLVAADGMQAYAIACEKKPDLIILDVLMPEMDGWQVLSQLKKNKDTKDIPVILLTGVSMTEGKERGLIEGVEDFLSKPFNPLRLLAIVEDIISTRKITKPQERGNMEKIRLGLICYGPIGLDMVKMLSGSTSVELIAVCDAEGIAELKEMVRDLGNIELCGMPFELCDMPDIDIIIDTRKECDDRLRQKAESNGIEILQGLAVTVFRKLLEEQETSRIKERSLVKELNTRVRELSVLNEMSHIMTSPLDLWFLLDKISLLATKGTGIDACAVLIYNEEQEKFVISNILGLDKRFKEKAKLSLSDPIAEEIMTLRRPMIIQNIREWSVHPLLKEAELEGMGAMGAIPLFSKERLLGIILAFTSSSKKISDEDINILSILAGQAGIAVENAYLYETTLSKQRQVETLLSKLIQVQEEERKRVAAEIHDTIAQSLVGIHTRVQTCQSLLKKAPEQLSEQLEDLKCVVADNVKEVRQIIFNLRPSSLDDLGLIPSLENYIKRFEKEQGIGVEFFINNRDKRLPPSIETAIFRIIQEALTNVKKHSGGRKAMVRLNIDPKMVTLRVADDGKGFQWEEVSEKFLKGDSHGVQGMKERVSMLGGTFKVTTGPEKGCMVSANIPLNRKTDNSADDLKNSLSNAESLIT